MGLDYPEIRKNLIGRIGPLGLARLLTLGTPSLLLFFLFWAAGSKEAGRFYVFFTTALLASMIADLGIGNAFPLLFGPPGGNPHPLLTPILRFRLALAALFGVGLAFTGGIGQARFSGPGEACFTGLFVFARVFLASHQGFHFAREDFMRLLRGAVLHASLVVIGFLLIFFNPTLGALSGLFLLCLGSIAELLVLDCPQARPLGKLHAPSSNTPSPGLLTFLSPFMLVGISGALYSRGDALAVSMCLSPSSAGVWGTLEAGFRLAVFPAYLSGQAVFPSLNAAAAEGNELSFRRHVGLHFRTSIALMAPLMVAGFLALPFVPSGVAGFQGAITGLLLCLPLSVTNSLLSPIFFSRRREKEVARLSLMFGVARPPLGFILASSFGIAGMAILQLFFDILHLLIYGLLLMKGPHEKEARCS
ncbi:MAG: hypothetical protein HQM09_19855 [Candidatus Riflebacteria bacterium]|nr:hypothetical protein [Candidatus Riflebacteria bacterium]